MNAKHFCRRTVWRIDVVRRRTVRDDRTPTLRCRSINLENGLALNFFARGARRSEYFSLQADWMRNRNDITLVSSFVTPQGGGFIRAAPPQPSNKPWCSTV